MYGQEQANVSKENQSRYTKMKTAYESMIANKDKKARTYRIENPRLKMRQDESTSLLGWLKNTHPNESEEKAYAQVRDTQETIEVIALEQYEKGYGLIGSNQDISDRLDESEVTRRIAQQTLRLPSILSAPYKIDRTIQELEKYNLRHLKSWQTQPWLKGALGILFDQDHCFVLNGYILKYDRQFGLTYEEVEHESI